jgi:hypothetical protein
MLDYNLKIVLDLWRLVCAKWTAKNNKTENTKYYYYKIER